MAFLISVEELENNQTDCQGLGKEYYKTVLIKDQYLSMVANQNYE